MVKPKPGQQKRNKGSREPLYYAACPVCHKYKWSGRHAVLRQDKSQRAYKCKSCANRDPALIKTRSKTKSRNYLKIQKEDSPLYSERDDGRGYTLIKIALAVHGRKSVWVSKHRWVVEQKMGRKLHSWESIHHKDGNRSNNDLSNLELWGKRCHGSGQRQVDLAVLYLKHLSAGEVLELLRKSKHRDNFQ